MVSYRHLFRFNGFGARCTWIHDYHNTAQTDRTPAQIFLGLASQKVNVVNLESKGVLNMNTKWTVEQLQEIIGLLGVNHVVAEHNRIVDELEQQARKDEKEWREEIKAAYIQAREERDRDYDPGRW